MVYKSLQLKNSSVADDKENRESLLDTGGRKPFMKALAKFMVGFMSIRSCINRFGVGAAVREVVAFLFQCLL